MDHSIDLVSLGQRAGLLVLVPYLSILFLLVALTLFVVAARQKRQAGIPAGRVIYTDTSHWSKVEKPLYDPNLHLSGKPDYLVEHGDQIIPVEVKSRHSPQAPYDSHISQLAAYCLLVNYMYSSRPDHGIIHYSDRTFAIDFTPALETSTKETIREMQELKVSSHVDRSHENPRCCHRCGYRSICDQSLRI